jgi:hypothetical protein
MVVNGDDTTLGTMLHYTGGAWQKVDGYPSDIPTTVQMLSPDEGWAMYASLYADTLMLHYTAGKWSAADTLPRIGLNDLMLISPSDGWAVGSERETGLTKAAIAYYDGTRWTRIPDDTSFPPLSSVSMVSADEGWAVGAASTILHYQRGKWTSYPWP